ncbi:protein mono-ADP-ribosyltransferase PARP15 isoform X1 [Sturnira hondurensis]|uniref:protein mono-ADP-ribosyltransferase PARP15 isoform X1 n=1 Tax=Sturnira hondurensis TaxID=192404 RepID=UPI00187A0FAB|nr:protein mono-ADP-ribosyltransferase PARP15 isoform X1 [Sturnira hondurensis]
MYGARRDLLLALCPTARPATRRSFSGRMSDRWKDRLSIGNVVASSQTKEGLNLVLISGDVSYFCADVIVNTVPTDLQLGGGSLSQALLQKAGPMLQKELNAVRQETEEEVGSIFMTSGCSLDCKAVLHVVAPDWDGGAGSSRQIMANIIKKCLTTVEQLSFSSITFPMIGTGNLGFPKATFAELILSEVLKFSSSAWLKTLREVHFLVHLDDDESRQAFLKELARLLSGNPNMDRIRVTGDTQGIFGMVTNPKSTGYEMKIGMITFQVAVGDIAKESTDVIVNSTTRMFNLKSGVSKAILEGAGPAVEDECAVLATQSHRDFIVTQGGYLMCKRIIHVLGENDVRKTVSSVLEECEQRKYKSVSLPAIGTGNAGKNPTRVADDMIDAVVDFTRKHSIPSLKKVKVVVFLTELLNVFYGSMKKREITTSPTFQSIFHEASFSGLHRQHLIVHGKSARTVEQNLSTDCSSEGQNCAWEAGITNEQEEESDDDSIPEPWTDTNQQPFCVIQLQPGQSEYDTVKERFSRTCRSYTIEKIERIQNAFLWQSYQIKKKHMDMKNGHMDNERILFHGTDADSVPHINQHGFNRSYAGKNAISYGKGTYFAVDASYSANDNYSRPDGNGRKHVYVARVLTGAYTLGHEELISPPSKNAFNSTDLFDSVTDDIQHPKIFVVFFDYQAYPEYLITFRC